MGIPATWPTLALLTSSPFQPLPLQKTVEVDAIEVVGKRGYAQVLMRHPGEGMPSIPVSPDTPGLWADGPALLLTAR